METLTDPQQELYDWLVGYTREHQQSPSIRQMMKAMGLKSPAPIQSRLEHLRSKGYIEWTEGKAHSIQLIQQANPNLIPILGTIAAGGLVETPQDAEMEYFDASAIISQSNYFILRIAGDSMIQASLTDGDLVILKQTSNSTQLKNGTIIAAKVEGMITLKHFYREGNVVILQTANSNYQPIQVLADQVEVLGILVGVWRNYEH